MQGDQAFMCHLSHKMTGILLELSRKTKEKKRSTGHCFLEKMIRRLGLRSSGGDQVVNSTEY